MAVIPSKDPRYNFDVVPDPPLERFLASSAHVMLTALLLMVGVAVVVWAWRTLF